MTFALDRATTELAGWTLLHFVWEGAGLALLLYVFVAFTRRPAVRYAAGLVTLVLMLAAPPVTGLLLAGKGEASALPSKALAELDGLESTTHASGTSPSERAVDWQSVLVDTWLLGVAVFSLRALGGYLAVRRLTHSGYSAVETHLLGRCRELERRMGLSRKVRYLQSRLTDAPAVVGWFKPIVLLPVTALSGLTPEQLEAVIVHELAHIRRLDCLVNYFQIAAETVLFYHPAVWLVNQFIRNERENCCDDAAVRLSGDAGSYARALTLMEGWRSASVLTVAANSGVLKQRITRILGVKTMKAALPQSGLAMIGCVCVAGAILSAAGFDQTVVRTTEKTVAVGTNAMPDPPAVPAAPVAPAVDETAPIPPNPPDTDDAQASPATPPPPSPNEHDGSYIDALKGAGLKDLSVDHLIALKVQGVTPEYIRAMRASGLDFSTHDLIGLKVMGVTPEYVKRVRAAGWGDVTAHKLIAMKAQNVDPEQAAAFKREFGADDFSFGKLMAFKAQGITPEYVGALRAAGFKDLSAGQIIGAKAQGITPEFIKKARDHGFQDLTLHQLIALKAADVF